MAEKNADREEFRGANHLRVDNGRNRRCSLDFVGSARWHRNIGNQQHLKGEEGQRTSSTLPWWSVPTNFVWERYNDLMRDVLSSCHERGTKKKFWVPVRNWTSDLRISELQCITSKPQRLHGERGLVRSFTWKNNSLYHLTGLKIYHLSYYIYKHDATDIADPNRMYNLERLPKWLSRQFERTQWSLLHLDDSVRA